jgi:hypothetical protein
MSSWAGLPRGSPAPVESLEATRGAAPALETMCASFGYEVIRRSPGGGERSLRYVSERQLAEGDVVELGGSSWIVSQVEETGEGTPRVLAEPARYRLVLRHEDGSEEPGAFRRARPGGPQIGHGFTTFDGRAPLSWQVVEQRVVRDDASRPYVEYVAERDYGEAEEIPNHELEHLADAAELREAAQARVARAPEPGWRMELVALDPGAEPDWKEAQRFVRSLVLEEVAEHLLELCGVDLDADPRDTWLPKAKERLLSDLRLFQADIEGAHEEIEEWDSGGARIFASVGTWDDEGAPDRGHGWMCRLVDSSALGAAGFHRTRKPEL